MKATVFEYTTKALPTHVFSVQAVIGLAAAGLVAPEDAAIQVPDGQALVSRGAVLVTAAVPLAPGRKKVVCLLL